MAAPGFWQALQMAVMLFIADLWWAGASAGGSDYCRRSRLVELLPRRAYAWVSALREEGAAAKAGDDDRTTRWHPRMLEIPRTPPNAGGSFNEIHTDSTLYIYKSSTSILLKLK